MDSLNEIWSCVLKKIAESGDFSEPTYNLWFRDIELTNLTNTYAQVNVKAQLKKDIISSRYLSTLEKYLEEVIGFSVDINLEVSDSEPQYDKVDIIETRPAYILDEENSENDIEGDVGEGGEIHMKYNPQYTFENFIVGNTNKYAHAACKAIAADKDHFYNPLFIYGDSGLGKTHLLYAITNEVIKRRKDSNVVYVRGEDFANELIRSLSKKIPMQYFRERFRTADVLLVDDIQFIAGKPSTQEEFFHTFNALYEDKKQIILASDRPPKDMSTLENRLRTRFEQGLIVDVQPPDYELRLAILKNKVQSLGLNISDNILIFLADNIKSNIRQLEGAVKRLRATSLLTEKELTLDTVKESLQDLFSNSVPVGITIDSVFDVVSRKYSVSVESIKGKKRTKEISNARHTAIYILRNITNMSLTDIGRYFNMHHTSVMSACERISEEIKIDPLLEHNISVMIREITGQ